MSVQEEPDYRTVMFMENRAERKASASSPSSGSSKETPSLHLNATELRLGLPGSQSPERELQGSTYLEKSSFLGAKRGFNDTIVGSSAEWLLSGRDNSEMEKKVEEKSKIVLSANESRCAPTAKSQIVGWPPIRSFRKSSMASAMAKSDGDGEVKVVFDFLFVKVSMEGIPYLRKVDLKTYKNYMELSSALLKMFSCFTIEKCGTRKGYMRDEMNRTSLNDFFHESEFVFTYEDKDGDWMLVGDVPWEMFIYSCKKLRIMKGVKSNSPG